MSSQTESTGQAEQAIALVEEILGGNRVMESQDVEVIEGNETLRVTVDAILREGEAIDVDAPKEP